MPMPQVLDGPDLSSGSGDASGQSAAAQRTASTDAAGTADAAAALAQQPGSEKLWAAAHIPDISKPGRGRKQNLLRGDGKALCAAIAPEHAKAVALVGNGPLTDESRGDITAADAIIRFNEMNNRWVADVTLFQRCRSTHPRCCSAVASVQPRSSGLHMTVVATQAGCSAASVEVHHVQELCSAGFLGSGWMCGLHATIIDRCGCNLSGTAV